MSAGPPTPPPTGSEPASTAASYAATLPAASSSITHIQSQSIVQAAFQDIAGLAIQGRTSELIEKAEVADLYPSVDNQQLRLLIVAPLVLSYLITDNLPPARDALLRLPGALVAHPVPQSLFKLLSSIWERNYELIYRRTHDLLNTVTTPDFFEPQLAAVVQGLSDAFLASFRQRMMKLINKAYTSIPLPLAQSYLGLSREEVLNASQQANWTYDNNQDILTPAPSSLGASPSRSQLLDPSSVDTFNLIIAGIAKFEV